MFSSQTPRDGGYGGARVVSARDFGTGEAGIRAMLAKFAAAGGGVGFIPPGTYTLSRPLNLTTKVCLFGAGPLTKLTRAATVTKTLTANANQGVNAVSVNNTAGLAVGQGITLYDDSSEAEHPTVTEIQAINGTTISFPKAVVTNLQTSLNAKLATCFPLFTNTANAQYIRLADMLLDHNRQAGDPTTLFPVSPITWIKAYYASVDHCVILNAIADAYSDQSNDPDGVDTTILETHNQFCNNVINSTGYHGVHLGTYMRGALVQGNTILGVTREGVHYSADITFTQVLDNYIYGCNQGIGSIDSRDVSNLFQGNVIDTITTVGIALGSGIRQQVIGNRFRNCATAAVQMGAGVDNLIQDNIVELTGGASGFNVLAGSHRTTLIGNEVHGGGAGSGGFFITSADRCKLIGNKSSGQIYPFYLTNADDCLLEGNTVENALAGNAVIFDQTCLDPVLSNNDFGAYVLGTPANAIRLVVNNLGDNGSLDPASAGPWNAATGLKYRGRQVRWDDGAGGQRISTWDGTAWRRVNCV